MQDTKDTPWDSMFIKSEVRAAAIKTPDPEETPDPDPRSYADRVKPQLTIGATLTFQENLEYIRDWDQKEMLGLIAAGIQLHEVDFDFLDHWRRNYQVPPVE